MVRSDSRAGVLRWNGEHALSTRTEEGPTTVSETSRGGAGPKAPPLDARTGSRASAGGPDPRCEGRARRRISVTVVDLPLVEGEPATRETVDPRDVATSLGHFVRIRHGLDPSGGLGPGSHNFFRGVALADWDEQTRRSIQGLKDTIDTSMATEAWERTLEAPPWTGPDVWIHGDLKSDNLLRVGDEITAVLDFGGLGVGDPACDLIVAWDLLTPENRDRFQAATSVDDATWARGRGWALSIAVIALPYYRDNNPGMVRYARDVLSAVFADRD